VVAGLLCEGSGREEAVANAMKELP
jgi:hypothetical protein